jgi:hypothetical protein
VLTGESCEHITAGTLHNSKLLCCAMPSSVVKLSHQHLRVHLRSRGHGLYLSMHTCSPMTWQLAYNTTIYIYTYIKLTFTYIPVHLTTTYTHRTPLPELRHATAPTACSINDAAAAALLELEASVRGRLRPMPDLSCAHPQMYMHVFDWLTTIYIYIYL